MLCNAWTDYKFISVCVCVYVCICVSVTLSVNSPTGQTPQRIFTVNSLKNADLRKDVFFGVSMMNYHIYGSKVPPNHHFGAWIGTKSQKFQDGGRPPFWKSIYRHISVKNHPISMKFCTQQQILNWMNVTWSKMKKLHWIFIVDSL